MTLYDEIRLYYCYNRYTREVLFVSQILKNKKIGNWKFVSYVYIFSFFKLMSDAAWYSSAARCAVRTWSGIDWSGAASSGTCQAALITLVNYHNTRISAATTASGDTTAYISGASCCISAWTACDCRAFASSRTLKIALSIDVKYFNTRIAWMWGCCCRTTYSRCSLSCKCHMIASYRSSCACYY